MPVDSPSIANGSANHPSTAADPAMLTTPTILVPTDLMLMPVTPRRAKRHVPEHSKDRHYWEKRKKNNAAAKRSREARRRLDVDIRQRMLYVEDENAALKKELEVLKTKFNLSMDRRYVAMDESGELVSEQAPAFTLPPFCAMTSIDGADGYVNILPDSSSEHSVDHVDTGNLIHEEYSLDNSVAHEARRNTSADLSSQAGPNCDVTTSHTYTKPLSTELSHSDDSQNQKRNVTHRGDSGVDQPIGIQSASGASSPQKSSPHNYDQDCIPVKKRRMRYSTETIDACVNPAKPTITTWRQCSAAEMPGLILHPHFAQTNRDRRCFPSTAASASVVPRVSISPSSICETASSSSSTSVTRDDERGLRGTDSAHQVTSAGRDDERSLCGADSTHQLMSVGRDGERGLRGADSAHQVTSAAWDDERGLRGADSAHHSLIQDSALDFSTKRVVKHCASTYPDRRAVDDDKRAAADDWRDADDDRHALDDRRAADDDRHAVDDRLAADDRRVADDDRHAADDQRAEDSPRRPQRHTPNLIRALLTVSPLCTRQKDKGSKLESPPCTRQEGSDCGLESSPCTRQEDGGCGLESSPCTHQEGSGCGIESSPCTRQKGSGCGLESSGQEGSGIESSLRTRQKGSGCGLESPVNPCHSPNLKQGVTSLGGSHSSVLSTLLSLPRSENNSHIMKQLEATDDLRSQLQQLSAEVNKIKSFFMKDQQ